MAQVRYLILKIIQVETEKDSIEQSWDEEWAHFKQLFMGESVCIRIENKDL